MKRVLLRRQEVLATVKDKFGEDTKMLHTAPGKCEASVKVQISPTF